MAFGFSRFQVTEIRRGRPDGKLLPLLLVSLGVAASARRLSTVERHLELVSGFLHSSRRWSRRARAPVESVPERAG
jgi:hypothetical protein